MIENVLEIKDTHVRELMTPLVDVVAIDSSAIFIDFHTLWVTHQYSRYIDTFLDVLVIFFLLFICNMPIC
jgi:CBS domain containing-hemolysin-like protein